MFTLRRYERTKWMFSMEKAASLTSSSGIDKREGCEGFSRASQGESCGPGDEYFQSIAFLAKSLSDANRLRIILCVSSGKKSVSAIVEQLGLSQPLVSHHLKELKRSLLVKIERDGPFIYYELVDARILDVVQTLSTVATELISARKTF